MYIQACVKAKVMVRPCLLERSYRCREAGCVPSERDRHPGGVLGSREPEDHKRNVEKFGAGMSYIQSQMHSDRDSAESIADSDPEDGELRKILASPL